jgi:predicted RecA/RadA family phage recombinase
MNGNGQTRSLAARKGFYDAANQITVSGGDGNEFNGITVNDTDIPATPRAVAVYTDFWTAETVICSGTLQVIGGVIGCLCMDTADGARGTYWYKFQGWFPVKSSDTITDGIKLYWDATNYEFTTTSGGNTAGAIVKQIDIAGSWVVTQTIATATTGSLPVGKFVHVSLIQSV